MGACLRDVLALGAHGDARARARPARIILEFLVEHTYNKDNCPYYRHPVLGGELAYFPFITGIIGSLRFRAVLDNRYDLWVRRYGPCPNHLTIVDREVCNPQAP